MTDDYTDKATDLFGEEVIKDVILREKFIEPPFSVLDTKSGNWQRRKRIWQQKGIKSEVGRDVKTFTIGTSSYKSKEEYQDQESESNKLNTSIFDPALCEVLYHWFCPDGGTILDPFAGGSVRGIVANYLYYRYTGIDIREEQVISNREQGVQILAPGNQPEWIIGDSDLVLSTEEWCGCKDFDLLFSCPPYADLEIYSDLPGDISNKSYTEFMRLYESIIKKSAALLKRGAYAVFVVGEVRDKDGYYLGFVPDTIRAFEKCGMRFYNEAILLNMIASASMRAGGYMSNGKLAKVHQNVLVFKKP